LHSHFNLSQDSEQKMHFATKKQGCCTKQKLRTTTLPDSTNPHELVYAALYVVQHEQVKVTAVTPKFQCRTQHYMWCNSVARSPCPARGERAFWKVVDFLCRFPLMGRHFHRKITASIGVFPCAARGCAKMENRDGRMRLCGIAVAFSTFLHHVCIIAENP